MPTYQYRCDACTNSFEQFQKFSEDPLTDCPDCDGAIQRVIGNVGIVFKGSGWYINDSRKSEDTSSKPIDTTAVKSDSSEKSAAAETVTKTPAKESTRSETGKTPTTAAAS